MPKQFKQMTEIEARQAIYIDFEGGKDEPPVFIGIMRKHVQQYVLDRAFKPAGPEYVELRRAIATIVSRAEKQDRRIASWSEHDLDIVRGMKAEPKLVRAFEARYANGRALAARWATRMDRIVKPEDGDLEDYLGLVGFDVPPHAAPGNVGETIRRLRPTLEAGRPLTPGQSQAWEELREHNRYDCEGMRAVCVRAAADLDRQDQRVRAARKGRKKRRVKKPKA